LRTVKLPFIPKVPLITADPLYGNVVSGAHDADVANEADNARVANELETAWDADVANEALTTLLTVTGNVVPFPFVNVIVAFDILAVVNRLLVSVGINGAYDALSD
jgi:hypothetical protein